MPSSSYEFKESKREKIKDFLVQNQADVVLVIGIIFIALISFGLGRITAPEVNKEPVVIEQNQESGITNSEASVLDSATDVPSQGTMEQNLNNTEGFSTSSNNVNSVSATSAKGIIVGSKNSNKYHWPWCAAAKNIKPENQIWFKSEVEAKAAGYQPCADFQKLAPAGYKP